MAKRIYWVVAAEIDENDKWKWIHADPYEFDYADVFPYGTLYDTETQQWDFLDHEEHISDIDDLTWKDLSSRLNMNTNEYEQMELF